MQISWGSIFSRSREVNQGAPQEEALGQKGIEIKAEMEKKLGVLFVVSSLLGFCSTQMLDSCDCVSILHQIHQKTTHIHARLPFFWRRSSKVWRTQNIIKKKKKPDLNQLFLWQLWKLLTFNTSSSQSPGVPQKLAPEQRFLKKQRFKVFYTKFISNRHQADLVSTLAETGRSALNNWGKMWVLIWN